MQDRVVSEVIQRELLLQLVVLEWAASVDPIFPLPER